MFLFWFIQKLDPPSLSRAYCTLVQPTNGSVLGILPIRDFNNWVIQELLLEDLAKTLYTRDVDQYTQ